MSLFRFRRRLDPQRTQNLVVARVANVRAPLPGFVVRKQVRGRAVLERTMVHLPLLLHPIERVTGVHHLQLTLASRIGRHRLAGSFDVHTE